MNITQLQYFMSAVKYGSFAKAAAKEFVSPQTVSKAIIDLERELGIELFDRATRPAKPTECAMKLFDFAAEAFEIFNSISDMFAKSNEATFSELRIGISCHNYHGGVCAKEVKDDLLKLELPFDLDVRIYTMGKCSKALSTGMIDAAIVAGKVDLPDLRNYKLASYPLGTTMSREHRLASKSRITLKDILDNKVAEPINIDNVYMAFRKMHGAECGICIPEFIAVEPDVDSYIQFIEDGGLVFSFPNAEFAKYPNARFVETEDGVLPIVDYYLACRKNVISLECAVLLREIKRIFLQHSFPEI